MTTQNPPSAGQSPPQTAVGAPPPPSLGQKTGAWLGNLWGGARRGVSDFTGSFRQAAPAAAPAATPTSSAPAQWFGMAPWLAILMGVLVILAVFTLSRRTIELNPSPDRPVNTAPDTAGLLTIGGITLPIKTVSVPNWPLEGTTQRNIMAFALVLLCIVVVFQDNRTARQNQKPAVRANWGLLFFLLGMFIPGWQGMVVGVSGVVLARRPRAGEELRPWGVIFGVGLFLFAWFEFVAPLLPAIFGWISQFAPWAPPFLEWLFSEDNTRPLVLLAWFVVALESALKKSIDSTTLVGLGLGQLGWFLAFGVWPYAEVVVPGAQLYTAMFWIIFWTTVVVLFFEHEQAGSALVAGAAIVFAVMSYLAALGTRVLANPQPNTPLYWLTTPVGSSLVAMLLISLGASWGQTHPNKQVQGLVTAGQALTGEYVKLFRVLAIPVDSVLSIAIIWIGLLVGTNLAAF